MIVGSFLRFSLVFLVVLCDLLCTIVAQFYRVVSKRDWREDV